MTNEMILKALECCAGTSPCISDNCPLWNEPGCQPMLAQAILDNIENGELVSKEWHDEQVLHAENVIDEQKAEIEKLLCKNAELEVRCEGVLKDYYAQSKTCDEQRVEIERLKEKFSISHYKDSWKNKFFKAQEEIERLTEENDELTSSLACERVVNSQSKAMLDNFHECDKLLRKENSELQKQVEKLTEEKNIFWKKYTDTCDENAKLSMILNQRSHEKAELQKQVDELKNEIPLAAKCTATQILQQIGNIWDDEGKFKFRNRQWFKDLCKRHSVEVE